MMVGLGIKAGGADHPACVGAAHQRDAVIVHVHLGLVTLAVRLDHRVHDRPCLAMILAAVNFLRARRVGLTDKRENVPVGFVHNDAAAHESWSDRDFRPPRRAAILAAPHFHAVPDRQHRAIPCDGHGGKTVALIHLLPFHLWLTQEWLEFAFRGSFRRERRTADGKQRKDGD